MESSKNRLIKRLFSLFLYIFPLVIGLFLHIGKVFLFAEGPIHATDLETPLSPLYYFWNIVHPWNPLGLGSEASINTFDFVYGLIAISSFGSALVSQLLVLLLPPIIAYFGVLLFTRKILNLNIYSSILASFFYAFAPPYLAWFSLPYMFGFSLLPILLYLILKIIIKSKTDHKLSFKPLIAYCLGVAIILSLITNIYFHALPFIILGFAIICIFTIRGEKQVFNKTYIFRLSFLLVLIVVLFIAVGSLPKLLDISTLVADPQRQTLLLRTEEPAQILESTKTFYKNTTLSNVIRLGGGTPVNERYIFLNSNPIGFIFPILVFLGLLFIKRLSNRKDYIYLACVINIIIFLAIILIFRGLTILDSPIVTNFIFAGIRRPERFLELLSLFYSIGLAFTFNHIQMIAANINGIKNFKLPHMDRHGIPILLLVFLILSHISYSGMASNASDPIYAQFFAPRPNDFDDVEAFLTNNDYQTSSHNSSFRYMIIPSYVQIDAYRRYNHPNFFYASSFSSREIQDFVVTTNNMIADQNPAAIIPLSFASVKYLVTLPQSFAEDELQSWRLNGNTRASGVNLFGDINTYLSFISKLPETESIYENKIHIFKNNATYPRIYIPNILIWTRGNMSDIFNGLRILENALPLSNFVLIVNRSEDITEQNFIIDDFGRQTRIKTTIFNLTDLNFEYKFEEEVKSINENSMIIWSQNKSISREGNYITLTGIIPANQQTLSMWVKIPVTNIPGTPMISTRLRIYKDMQDKIDLSILDQDGNLISAMIEKTISPITDDKVYIDVLINPAKSNSTWFKMILRGSPSSTVEIWVKDRIKFQQLTDLELYLTDIFDSTASQNNDTFPITIDNYDNITVLWPTEEEEGVIKYSIDTPIDPNKASLLLTSTCEGEDGWVKVDEDIKWISPVDIDIDLDISPASGEKRTKLVIPIFFGNGYDTSWKLHPISENGNVTRIEHMIGNGFGNLWLVYINGIWSDGESFHLFFELSIDTPELLLYRSYSFITVVALLLFLPLFIISNIYDKFKRRNKQT